jgi:hypothetical protein
MWKCQLLLKCLSCLDVYFTSEGQRVVMVGHVVTEMSLRERVVGCS